MDNRSSNTRRDPLTEASEFFIEFRAGDATPDVRAQFEKWLRSSLENVQAYLEIAEGWSELPTADPEERIDTQALLAAAHTAKDGNIVHLERAKAPGIRQGHLPRTWLWALAGSVAILMMALAGAGFWIIGQGGRAYDTGIGEQRTLILADGSTVMLNALTTVRVHMTQDVREVTLVRGQAFFHDTNEPSRPFIVRAGWSSVRAIGTEFDVSETSDRTVVTVVTGQVAVAKSPARIGNIERRGILRELAGPTNRVQAVVVSAGEQVTVLAQNVPAPTPVDVTAVTAWREQRLVFEDTPLEKVAQQFNLYSKKPLVILDASLRNVGVTGEYSASDPGALIGFLRSQPTLRVVEKNGQFLVSRP